jgi:cytochrome c-type biogenesis protein CcmH/NrfG
VYFAIGKLQEKDGTLNAKAGIAVVGLWRRVVTCESTEVGQTRDRVQRGTSLHKKPSQPGSASFEVRVIHNLCVATIAVLKVGYLEDRYIVPKSLKKKATVEGTA